MPVSIVVGGQYGSEGKGKVALELVRRDPSIRAVVRPGGTNSGHTGYTKDGRRIILRQLPAAAIDGGVTVILPAGSYIDAGLLKREVEQLGLAPPQLIIDPRANIISQAHTDWESRAGLVQGVGSTGSGTGAAVLSRLMRGSGDLPQSVSAREVASLVPYLAETGPIMDGLLRQGFRILLEGTQGYGLSPLHGDAWPHCTSRDTTAAAFLSEAGLAPLTVDEVVLVIRCHPIRVAGNSGPLALETTWSEIGQAAGAPHDLSELTSVTQKVRRVGHFDATIVRKAIAANQPTKIVLNHLDYVDWRVREGLTPKALGFIRSIEAEIDRVIDWVGVGPTSFEPLAPIRVARRA